MPKCPSCKEEIAEEDKFCKNCGTKLIGLSESQANAEPPSEEEVKTAVTRRLDGIKNRDEGAISALMDARYTKFDDWPPFGRQEAAEALKNEFGAFKVLSNYSYELKDFETNALGNTAVATYLIHYQGVIRDKPFDVTSRVTSILRKEDSGWKVIHEHFSRFPEETKQQPIASPSPQTTSSTSPPSYQPARNDTRRFATLGFISAVVSLFMMPEIFGSAAIILGAYTWRKEREGTRNLGIIVLIAGITCLLVGLYFTSLFTVGDLFPS